MSKIRKRPTEKMSDRTFKNMTAVFKIVDLLFPYIPRRIKKFDIQPEMTVVDYGCGPGRYTIPISQLVGEKGKVFAVDIHELAIAEVEKKINEKNISNIETVLASGMDAGKYDTKLSNNCADVVCAIDMFFIIKQSGDFLLEIKRILKQDGFLIIDDGHQSRKETKRKIEEAGIFKIFEETRDHLKCRVICSHKHCK